MSKVSFCRTKILKKLHLFLRKAAQKAAFIFKESCSKKLDLGLCTTRLCITSNPGSDTVVVELVGLLLNFINTNQLLHRR